MGRPVPTRLFAALFTAALLPAVLAAVDPLFARGALAVDLALIALCALDFALAPGPGRLSARRRVADVLSAGEPNRVELEIEACGGVACRGEVRDEVAPGPTPDGHHQAFELTRAAPVCRVAYRLTPLSRGDLAFGAIHLRATGPLGLCARQWSVPAGRTVKVYPDLTALTREALELARASDAASDRTIRRPAEGREFESLRDYRQGDDYRTIDWKATARRSKPMVRVYQPERNQPVMLLLDCGRHMAGKVGGRRKLDHAIDAALRVAKVCLDKGDQVGVVAFSTRVLCHLPPRKGKEHLATLTGALYRLEATLEESDYGQALDLAFARHHRRTLVVVFTDLLDPDTSAAVLSRTLALRPRHLPLVVSLADEELEEAAKALPLTVQAAYVRQAAARIEDEHRLTVAKLRDAGALVVRSPASRVSAAAVNEYLRVKAHGLL